MSRWQLPPHHTYNAVPKNTCRWENTALKHLFKSKILSVALGTLTAVYFMASMPAAAQDYWLGQIVSGIWNPAGAYICSHSAC